MEKETNFQPDDSQREVIKAEGGYHLVLAPPGCGKTQILTERIRRAHQKDGVAYSDMLCLTFTNRAARGMVERIRESITDDDISQVYVGNVHRFCSKFLFENNIIPAETSIIDDEDAISIVARYLDEDERKVTENATRRREYFDFIHFSHFMRQLRSSQPRELRMHPECCNSDNIAAMKKICEVQQMPVEVNSMLDIYDHTDFYLTASRMDGYDLGSQVIIDRLLNKMNAARQYEQYKRENHLVDFEDLLIMTYDSLSSSFLNDSPESLTPSPSTEDNGSQVPPTTYKRYRWIQVDEVQDLNPLQLAIIDLITEKPSSHTTSTPAIWKGSNDAALRRKAESEERSFTVMYLGDEQQAIFSFMGARLGTLNSLRQRCQGHLHHLSTNHRSPSYLLEVYNEYARNVLGIDKALLPKAAIHTPHPEQITSPSKKPKEVPLRILRSNILETEYFDVSRQAQLFQEANPDETTAIIVNSNADADLISAELQKLGQSHFKVSGEDLFATREMKLLLSHLNVLANEHNFIAWARLLKGFGVTASNAYARNFVQSLRQRAMLPSDFLVYENSTYLEEFVRTYESEEIVVFDTETTGLDVFNDEIVQIAAVRMQQGEIVEGSAFNVYMQTTRPIPEKLGDIDNPILEELKHHELLSPQKGLQCFLDYVGNSPLLGHNAMFDWQILQNNIKRQIAVPSSSSENQDSAPLPFDSLKLIRLLAPDLKQYKLKYLLAVLGLEGENSHLADADVAATCSLVNYCYQKAQEALPQQRKFREQARVQERAKALRRSYRDYYRQALATLNEKTLSTPALLLELQRFHDHLVEAGVIEPVSKLHYVLNYVEEELLDPENEQTLGQQLAAHIIEINTLKEADLCNSHHIEDRIFVTTVHKAKGLEFDNVIVFDAVEDRYPSYFNRNNPTAIAEDARKFYVAITRARKRLYVSQCLTRIDFHNQHQKRRLTRFMLPIQKYFG